MSVHSGEESRGTNLADHVDPRRAARVARLARRIASSIADTADADQVAISIDGIDELGDCLVEELIPRSWLLRLNGGRPAVHRVSIALQLGGRRFGMLRLATLRPCGFQPDEIARAQMDAYHASLLLSAALTWDGASTLHDSSDVIDIATFRRDQPRSAAREPLAG